MAIAEKFSGKATKVGNSKGYRIDSGLFKAHPEFEGDVQLTILGEGQALLSAARPAAGRKAAGEESDPVLMGFLGFLERQMAAHPEDIVAADEAQLKRIAKLVKGVKP
jgi:hypothetical protein